MTEALRGVGTAEAASSGDSGQPATRDPQPLTRLSRRIVRASAEGTFTEILPEQARAWAATFSPNAARRMTRLGLLLGHVFREFTPGPEDAVVYATTFAEALTTERYLGGFPAASPLFFQTSIHPSAIEQVLINRMLPVRELTPLAGQEGVGAQAIVTALLSPGPRVFLCGGEELGTWLGDIGACSPVAFAFALELVGEEYAGETLGEVSWTSSGDGDAEAAGDLRVLFEAVRERRSLRWAAPGGGDGELTLAWG